MSEVVQLLKDCQKKPYNFLEVEILQEFLHWHFQQEAISENEMYKLSKQIEP